MPRHICALCGQISFATYHEFETHRAGVHNMKTAIKPENITGRTRDEITDEAEAVGGWLNPYLIKKEVVTPSMIGMPVIESINNEHLNACRCNECWNKKLDALIASQEASLVNLNNGGHNADTI